MKAKKHFTLITVINNTSISYYIDNATALSFNVYVSNYSVNECQNLLYSADIFMTDVIVTKLDSLTIEQLKLNHKI